MYFLILILIRSVGIVGLRNSGLECGEQGEYEDFHRRNATPLSAYNNDDRARVFPIGIFTHLSFIYFAPDSKIKRKSRVGSHLISRFSPTCRRGRLLIARGHWKNHRRVHPKRIRSVYMFEPRLIIITDMVIFSLLKNKSWPTSYRFIRN